MHFNMKNIFLKKLQPHSKKTLSSTTKFHKAIMSSQFLLKINFFLYVLDHFNALILKK